MNKIEQLLSKYNFKYNPCTQKFQDETDVVTTYVVNVDETDNCNTYFLNTEDEVVELIKKGIVWDVNVNKSIPTPDIDYLSQIDDKLFEIMKKDMEECDPELYVQIKDFTSVKQITDENVKDELIYQLVEYY